MDKKKVIQKHVVYKRHILYQKAQIVGHWWLMPEILAIQEAEIRRIVV
jgi:hypothetical protein